MNRTVDNAVDHQVARYAAAVRGAFADLPGPRRELLLEDLEDHLLEVAAEAGGPLTERLGQPEAYAAELRASAGLAPVAAGAARPRGAGPWLRETWGAVQLRRLWGTASTHPAGRAVLEFLPELRPAWWVLRGYLAVQALSVAVSYLAADLGGLSFPVPQLSGSRVLGLLATAAAVAGSVALGRRGPTRRGLVVLGNLGLSLFAVAMLLELGASEAYDDQYHPEYVTTYSGPVSGLRADGKEISNLFPFDEDGKPLKNVYLVDQDGDPVVATHNDNELLEPEQLVDGNGDLIENRYPQHQQQLDQATGEHYPAPPAPAFRPPPEPVRSS
jgi:hypothetical protein